MDTRPTPVSPPPCWDNKPRQEGEPIRVDWLFDQLAGSALLSPTASVLIGVHEKVGGRWTVDLVHCLH